MSFQEIERLSDEAISLNENFDELEQDLDTHLLGSNITDTEDLLQQHEAKRAMLDNVGHPLIQRGEHLISSIKANEPPVPPSQNFPGSAASLPSQERQQVEDIVTHLKLRCDQLMDMWEKRWKELMQCMDLREFEAGYQKVQTYQIASLRWRDHERKALWPNGDAFLIGFPRGDLRLMCGFC